MTVIDGADVWALSATIGLPLEMSLSLLCDKDCVPSWDRLLEAAQKDGTNMSRLLRRLHEMVGDAYPPDAAAVIRERLGLLAERMGLA